MSSIFIQIPSYRDWELPKTVSNAISRASGQNELYFGIHNCVLFPGEVVKPDSPVGWAQIRYEESIAPNNIGLQKARYIANELYDGEDYYLQIDSHMRFVQDWDLKVIKMIEDYILDGIENPLITMYPPSYWYEEDGVTEKYDVATNLTRILFTENPAKFKETLIPTQTAHRIPDGCVYTASTSGGFIFTSGSFANIKPNQKIAFWGEEPLIAARAFTHGFNLVVPTEYLVYHLYANKLPFQKIRRNHVWVDVPQQWGQLSNLSNIEYSLTFTENRVGNGALGSSRALRDYEEFAGLNFTTREILQNGWV